MAALQGCREKCGASAAQQIGVRAHGSGKLKLNSLHCSIIAVGNCRMIPSRGMGCSEPNFPLKYDDNRGCESIFAGKT